MKLTSFLYQVARIVGKTASVARDIEVISSGDPKKIARRVITKSLYHAEFRATNKLMRPRRKK